jgi:transcription elongation factor GreA
MIARKVWNVNDHVGNQITPDGLAALEAELHALETEGRRAMAERLRTARAWGDLKENSEYHDAKDAQAHLETKILRLRELRRNAVVVQPGATGGAAGLGVAVTVRDLDSGREATHTLVSAAESDPGSGRLSIDSPLGRALAGARPGDEIAFDAPRGRRRLEVVALDAT